MPKRETSYELFLREEGIPVIQGYGVKDVTALERKFWQRTGGRGAYIDLKGMEGFTGMYVGEIPAGGAMHYECHLYEELIYIFADRLHGNFLPATKNARCTSNGSREVCSRFRSIRAIA